MLAETLKPPNPSVLACTDSDHLGAQLMMHGAMELFPTATCETYLTMSTQIAFTCDACEMKFQEETSLMEHRMQDYQTIVEQALQQLNNAWRHMRMEVPRIATHNSRYAENRGTAHLRQAASSPSGPGPARSSLRQKERCRCPHPECHGNNAKHIVKNIKRHYYSHFTTQLECPKCLITLERLDHLFRNVTVKKCQRLREEYWHFKRQADIDLDRRWSLRPWPPATAETPTPQHDIGDHEAVQSDSTGHSHNDAWEISASSCSAAQKGADSSYTAEFAGSWKANEARELSSLAETSALLSSCEERHFPVNEIQNSIDESSWPSDSASVLNFSQNSQIVDDILWAPSFFNAPVDRNIPPHQDFGVTPGF